MNKDILHLGIALLSRREHAEKELVEKMKQRKFFEDDIYPVIAFLQQENYQSDQRYAESYCRNRIARGYGWRYIKNALKLQGVNHEIITELNKNDEIDWYLQAELAYNKRFGTNTISDQKDKAKRIRFLQYRGFSTDQIMAVLNHE